MVDAPGRTGPLLSVEKLAVGIRGERGTFEAISDVDLVIEQGEVLGLVGESGCGKSITATAVMGLLPHPVARIVRGRILFDGRDLTAMAARPRRRLCGEAMGMIFQEPMTSLNPVYRIGDQLTEALRAHRRTSDEAAVAEAVRMLDMVGIPSPRERIRAYPHELSGGMRQRVM
ncbi:MAG: ABC transporter ATP-binding protein, partial [Geminicoccaceae bacterium]|nr:ABC transporter ATP-binding protein [Geminicoccaceae bacterium]